MSADFESLTKPVASVLAEYPKLELPLLRSDLRENPRLGWFAGQGAARLFPAAREAECAYSGLLLLLGGWQQCHEGAQDIARPCGSYWHAIAHRMEPDYANAGYWYRRAGPHPRSSELGQGASILAGGIPEAAWKAPESWDPFAFMNLCEAAVKRPEHPRYALASAIQSLEWELLFAWCAAPARA